MVVKMQAQYGVILVIIRIIYKEIRPWLEVQAGRTDTPIDDWMIAILDKLLLE